MALSGLRRKCRWLSPTVLAAALLSAAAPSRAGDIVISQIYVNGGAATATWRNDYVELHNRSANPVSLSGWSIQYAANTGTSWNRTNLTATTLAPGQFYLVQLSAGAGGGLNPLPAPDATGSTNIGNGKLALMRISTTITSGISCPVTDPSTAANLEDFVGLGSSNCFEGAAAAPANPNGSTATYRREVALGCTDTDQNSADFTTDTANPRNTATTTACDEGACCFGANCSVTSLAGCSGGVFRGAGSTCSPDPCVLGACCLDTGACLLLDINDCGLQGGVVFLGEGTACTGGACTPGACCFEGSCYFYPREWCSTSPPGRYNGDGVVCAGLDPSCSLGACCGTNGSCTYALEQDCLGAGVYMGLNATCSPALCAPAGACCFGSFGDQCEIRFASNCMLSSGDVYRGDGTTCTPGQCPNTAGACCQPDESCVQASIGTCTGVLNGTHQGTGVACTINLCVSDPIGACCRPAICDILTQSLCASVSGTFIPNQTSCAANPCGAPLGACCFGINCSIVSASICGANLFLGAGSSCVPDPCGTGACCTLAGACSITDVTTCDSAGSIYLGNGSTCSPGVCSDIGACCFDTQCSLLPAVACQNLSGDPRGMGTGCTPTNDCLTVVFAACCQADICELFDADTCNALGGTFLPAQSTCDANPCGAPLGACCFTLDNRCEIRSAAACSGPGGGPKVFHGPGTSCVSSPCGDPGLGACCIASTCTTRIASTCASAGGTFLGAGAACDANTCLTVGACCLTDGACVELTSSSCTTSLGVYSGDGTTCTAGLCPRGCCLPDQSCVFVTSAACAGLGGTSRPGACSPSFCFVTCCAPDGTCTLVSNADCLNSGGLIEGQGACGPFNCFGACCVSGSGACLVRGKANCITLGYTYLGYQTPCLPTTCTGACCIPGTLTCTLEYRGDCIGMGGLFVGFNVPCGPSACPGVCCTAMGCVTLTQTQCEEMSGTYRFHGFDCAGGACTGACCDSSGGCTVTFPASCGSASVFRGLGTVCDVSTCAGACCVDGVCTQTTVAMCTGSFLGVGTSCTPSPCGGACCVRDAAPFCRILPQSECTPASGGIYLGDGTTCTATNVCFGACCFDPAVEGVPLVCQFTSLGFCYGQNGEFRGLNTACQSPPGSGNWVECCIVNVTMTDGVTVQDLFTFMQYYFEGNLALADVNRNGVLSVQDIFDFLAGFFFSCS